MIIKIALLLVLLLAPAAPAAAQIQVAQEYEVKAAFLYNFAKFVEWPAPSLPAADAPLVIGLLGKDPFGAALEQAIAGKRVDGRPLIVKHLADANTDCGCQILFVGPPAALVEATPLARPGVLTVGDADGFTQRGGIIQFVIQDNRVRFAVNVEAAERAGIKISSQFLKLALTQPTRAPQGAD